MRGHSGFGFIDLIGLGAGGIAAIATLYGLYANSMWFIVVFPIAAILSGLFIDKSAATSCAIFVLGAFIFGLDKHIADMIFSIIFFVVMIIVIAFHNYAGSQ